ncbi:hypothetical protein CkaCkLH20_02497 [Colletotrichum karsti]|uniref:Alpha-1,2-mannosyltransferase n=1 Tax=Colletotrichum karsti TaxID=1095194 RepID=A0A9P6ID69_9PEZI|nr:uncharacterized protein CkaCkLH20_02497 [Colletotrichum karsti]KAF9879686.1 hypothetical protein CkaCkLH20_02497 [Colletotrichum karsti]
MLFPNPRRRPPYLLLTIPILLTLLYIRPSLPSLFHHPRPAQPLAQPNATTHLLSPAIQKYWSDLHSLLAASDPSIEPLKSTRDPTQDELVDETLPRPDVTPVSESALKALKSAHATYVFGLKSLARRLPTWEGSAGIVMTAGGGYLGTAWTSILMLRRAGSALPVHLFLDSPADYDPHLCGVVLPKLGAECLLFSSVLRPADGVSHYQYKVLSILLSPFERVLYLDSDAWPILSPDHLFATEPFASYGLITWPDFWLSTMSPHFNEVAGFEAPPLLKRRTSESGILLYDKRSHARSLLLATFYNWYGPGCFYPLLSQHAPGEGDKETFVQAALALSEPFYDVWTPDDVVGRWINGSYETAAMLQADPAEDYRLQSTGPGADLTADHAKEPPAARKAKPLFIHHNLFKVNLFKIGASSDPMFRLDEKGRLGRLWGLHKKVIKDSGFDVERAMWDTVFEANCGLTSRAGCGDLKRWYEAVFDEAEPLVDGL